MLLTSKVSAKRYQRHRTVRTRFVCRYIAVTLRRIKKAQLEQQTMAERRKAKTSSVFFLVISSWGILLTLPAQLSLSAFFRNNFI